jgi:signal transduction histidine kinase
LGIFLFIIKYITKNITSFSIEAKRIMEGDFSSGMYSNKEGVFSILRTQFYQMSKRLNMSIEQLSREKDSMKSVVTDMSHQLKTPVASLKLSNSLLLEKDLSSEEREEFLQKCNEDIDKLDWLVSSLIKMSRMEADIIEIDMKKGSIKNTIIKAVSTVYVKALNKGIDIDMENLQDDTIEHDVKWTKEALTNILENAVKYTKNGGRIKISAYQLPSLFKVDIEDNGIGIPEKEINNIFKKFYRGNSKEVTEAEGLGVGLYLSRKIIEKQGGSIMVHSREGGGSRFTVFLQKCYEN